VDGGGGDQLSGNRGSDTIRLVETSNYARDTVLVGIGESLRGTGRNDLIAGDPTSTTTAAASGFDSFSTDITKHDILNLQSALIVGDTATVTGSTSGTTGAITQHSISSGIVTFRDAGGAAMRF
jgi:hypothetical protein